MTACFLMHGMRDVSRMAALRFARVCNKPLPSREGCQACTERRRSLTNCMHNIHAEHRRGIDYVPRKSSFKQQGKYIAFRSFNTSSIAASVVLQVNYHPRLPALPSHAPGGEPPLLAIYANDGQGLCQTTSHEKTRLTDDDCRRGDDETAGVFTNCVGWGRVRLLGLDPLRAFSATPRPKREGSVAFDSIPETIHQLVAACTLEALDGLPTTASIQSSASIKRSCSTHESSLRSKSAHYLYTQKTKFSVISQDERQAVGRAYHEQVFLEHK